MRVVELEKFLLEKSMEDLEKLIRAIDVCMVKLPQQVIVENKFQLLRDLTALVLKKKKEGTDGTILQRN